MARLLVVLGAVLILGGLGHTLGVIRFYVTTLFP